MKKKFEEYMSIVNVVYDSPKEEKNSLIRKLEFRWVKKNKDQIEVLPEHEKTLVD